MGRHYKPPTSLTVLVWLACVSAAYIITMPFYTGFFEMQDALRRLRKPPTAESYLVARHTLPIGHVIGEADLDWGQTPGFFPPEALQDVDRVIDKSVSERILGGDAIRPERLSEYDGHGIAALVPPKMRAMPIELTTADRVSGFVEPGDRVDVLVTLKHFGQPYATIPVLQNVMVIAAADPTERGPLKLTAARARVTVITTPQDATRLAHALRIGVPRLVLRPEDDAGELQPVDDFVGPLPTGPVRREIQRQSAQTTTIDMFSQFVRAMRGPGRMTAQQALRKAKQARAAVP